MAPPVYRPTQAPSFGGSAAFARGATQALSQAGGAFDRGVERARILQQQERSNPLLIDAAKVGSEREALALLNGGATNIAARNQSPELLAAMASLREKGLKFDGTRAAQGRASAAGGRAAAAGARTQLDFDRRIASEDERNASAGDLMAIYDPKYEAIARGNSNVDPSVYMDFANQGQVLSQANQTQSNEAELFRQTFDQTNMQNSFDNLSSLGTQTEAGLVAGDRAIVREDAATARALGQEATVDAEAGYQLYNSLVSKSFDQDHLVQQLQASGEDPRVIDAAMTHLGSAPFEQMNAPAPGEVAPVNPQLDAVQNAMNVRNAEQAAAIADGLAQTALELDQIVKQFKVA